MSSADSLEHVSWQSAASHVGPVEVRRPLPMARIKSVGPFVLLDHFGPIPAPKEKLPAHPHAGIEVMTYLMEGANEHTDSLGNIGQIGPGGAQWMKSGRGILHTERNLLDRATTMHGLQIWARLPITQQDDAPVYQAYQASDMAKWTQAFADIRLIAGEMGDQRGPIPLASPSLMAHITVHGGARSSINLPDVQHEYAIYVISGQNGFGLGDIQSLSTGTMVRLATGTEVIDMNNLSSEPAEIFLLGGEPAPQPLVFGGSYVLDSLEAINQADQRFRSGEMGTLDGVPF
ncbi:MAG: pirin family protein [Pseudomonadota bacterium]